MQEEEHQVKEVDLMVQAEVEILPLPHRTLEQVVLLDHQPCGLCLQLFRGLVVLLAYQRWAHSLQLLPEVEVNHLNLPWEEEDEVHQGLLILVAYLQAPQLTPQKLNLPLDQLFDQLLPTAISQESN